MRGAYLPGGAVDRDGVAVPDQREWTPELGLPRSRVGRSQGQGGRAVGANRASGVIWPMMNPCDPPLNLPKARCVRVGTRSGRRSRLPSVSIATSFPSPAPMIAEVGVSISGIPGPPLGPSYLA